MRKGRDIRLIDADALANYADNQIVGITANDIMRFPTVDAEPVKHGGWKYDKTRDQHFCSMCGDFTSYSYLEEEIMSKYCPNCGARMDGDTK